MRKIILTLFLVFSVVFITGAQENQTIVDHITASGRNVIIQPVSLKNILTKADSDENKDDDSLDTQIKNKSGGYRVQIFSDNNSKTAKNEARSRSNKVGEFFPQYRTYVTYNSPYWRVRVGDFKTRKEAEAALEEIKDAFPQIKKEIRIVQDRINVFGY